jgi:hypothetical protein
MVTGRSRQTFTSGRITVIKPYFFLVTILIILIHENLAEILNLLPNFFLLFSYGLHVYFHFIMVHKNL